jgi:hypothetical protein
MTLAPLLPTCPKYVHITGMMTTILLLLLPHYPIWLVAVRVTMEVLPYGMSLRLPSPHQLRLFTLCLLHPCLLRPPAYCHPQLHRAR